MEPFRPVCSVAVPLERANIDTDQIVPKQFLKRTSKAGFGEVLFYGWRYADGNPDPAFILNDSRYAKAQILVTGENFGCGSSREHAVWALLDHGFRVIIAPSFADIFYSNCTKNGLLAIRLEKNLIGQLVRCKTEIGIDLESQKITYDSNTMSFDMDSGTKKILLEGLDDITLTLRYEKAISEYEGKSSVPSVW